MTMYPVFNAIFNLLLALSEVFIILSGNYFLLDLFLFIGK